MEDQTYTTDYTSFSFLIEDKIKDYPDEKRLVIFWECPASGTKIVEDILQHSSVGFKSSCRMYLMEKMFFSKEEFEDLWKNAEAALKESKDPNFEPKIFKSEKTVFVIQRYDEESPAWKDTRANDIESLDAVKVHLKAYNKAYKNNYGDRFTFRIVKRYMKITDEVV
jgi:hypothetical protein